MKMKDLPAIEGGKPVRETLLPYGRQWIEEDDIQAVVEVLRGDFLTTGPKIKEFEEKFADYVGAKYAVAVANGTAALHAAVFAAGIKEGDEVITTPITFAATSNSVIYQGGTPVFADVLPRSLNIDPADIEQKITDRTKAIIPVDLTGHPANLNEINDMARKYNLTVIEDAAHALGAMYKDKPIGSLSNMTTFSFHPVKHITTGEGGMVTTNDRELYKKLMLFRTHGITRDPQELYQNHGPWYYEMQDLGYNYRLTDIQAVLGISQLSKSDAFLKRRREIARIYTDAFAKLSGLEPYVEDKGVLSSWHLYIIRLNLNELIVDRKKIFEALRAENIGVNVHYIPVYTQPHYKSRGYNQGLCPVAEDIYQRIISIPIFPAMSNDDVNDVIQAVRKIMNYYQK